MTVIEPGLYRCSLEEFYSTSAKPRSVLNLETQTRELIYGDPNKQFRFCQEHNIIFFDVAWSGIFPPKKEDIFSALGVLRHGIRPLMFHCRAGRERTGFLAAAYGIWYQNMSFEFAYSEWKKDCRWPTYWLWKNRLREISRCKELEK